jgi:multisubunit Na+/H+ antiporter MnhG subunit
MHKERLPYSQSALILGVSSIVTACCCWGLTGIILGAIGLHHANKAMAIHYADPDQYDGINNAQTGKTTSIIGIVVGILMLLWMIYQLATGDFQMILEEYNELMGQQI